MTGAYLEVEGGGPPGERLELVLGRPTVVGRSPAADIVLSDSHLSGRHFEISWRDGRAWVRDLDSTNGIRVDEVRVTEKELEHGDVIAAGSHRFRVHVPGAGGAAAPGPPRQGRPTSPPPPPPAAAASPGRPPATRSDPIAAARAGQGRWLLAAAAVAAVVAFAAGALILGGALLVGDSGRWDLLPSMARSVLGSGWGGRLRPAPALTTGTAAVDVRPHPAVRLTAPAGALDTERELRVTELMPDELETSVLGCPTGLMVPLAGVRLESGMEARDLFPGALTVTLDLKKLGVPEDLRDLVDVFHVDAEGALRRQPVRRSGRRVSFELRHNGPILIGALAVALGALFTNDEAQKWGGAGGWLGGGYWFYDYESYRVWYPRSLGWRKTPELQRVEAALERRWQANRPRPPGSGSIPLGSGPASTALPEDRHERAEWARAYLGDPEVQELLRRSWRDPAWVRAHALSWPVVYVVSSLERAHEYLFKHRKLRPPSGGSVDVILLRDWNQATGGGSQFGFAADGAFLYPYIQLNRDKVPDDERPSPVYLDSLDTTILHELFHVAQKEYFNWSKYLNPGHAFSGARYTWFMEATALLLEEEAKPYYTTVKKWTRTHFETTFDRTEHFGYFKLPLDATGKNEQEAQRKGYAASRFLLKLEQRYYSRNSDAFLPTYLGAFCSFSNPVEALVASTSRSSEMLGADYLLFSSQHARALAACDPKPGRVELTAVHPVRSWPLVPGPLSTPFWRLDLSSSLPGHLKDAILVLRTHRLRQYGVVTRYAVGGGDFKTATSPTGTEVIPARGAATGDQSLEVQRVETYVDTPWSMGSIARTVAGDDSTTVLLMLPPVKPPKLELLTDTKKLRVTLTPSPLWKAGELKEFQIRIGPPDRKAFTFTLGDTPEAEIPWEVVFHDVPQVEDLTDGRVRALLVQQDLVDMHAVWNYLTTVIEPGELKVNVRYREVAKCNPDDPPDAPGIDGPWSQVFDVPLDRDKLAKLDYDVSGTWKGTAMILHDPVRVTLQQRGADVEGTCVFGGVVYRMEGAWRSEEKGWEVQLLAATSEGLAGSLVTPYMRRMAGEELWLAWPTCVLRRDPPPKPAAEDERGWLDRLLGR